MAAVSDAEYAQLAALRAAIREYLAWAEQRAADHGLTPAHVQLALAIRAHDDPAGPTIGQLATTLLLRHHSVVGLVDRAEAAGLVERRPEHPSRVRVVLTAQGAGVLETLSGVHVAWLREHGAGLSQAWAAFE